MKRVVIIGGNAKEKHFSPPADDAEIWGLNAIRPAWVPDWSRMFNLHLFAHLQRDWPKGIEREKRWIAENKAVPFYTCDPWPDWAVSQRLFPREELPKLQGEYHAGSFDWLVAYAVHLGFNQIDLHGIGLNLESGEPISARACLEFWCGYAHGRGIEVIAAPDCDLFRQYHLVRSRTVYGYDDVALIEDLVTGKIDNSRGGC